MVVMRKQRDQDKAPKRKAWYIEVLIYMTVTKSGVDSELSMTGTPALVTHLEIRTFEAES